jgi:hypothetical protein
MAFDAARGESVVFGGENGSGTASFADTWVWDGASWLLRTPAMSPPALTDHAMAYDDTRQRVVLFGGVDANGTLSADTWEWDGTTWTQRFPTQSPPARRGHAVAHDKTSAHVLLFGGDTGGIAADTWTWDGTRWTLLAPPQSPPARHQHAMAHDTSRRRTVLFGGIDANGVHLSDTWEWDGATWTQAAPQQSPSARCGHAMAFDQNLQRVVTFAGADWVSFGDFNDTWLYGTLVPASAREYGNGCSTPRPAAYIGPPGGEAGGPIGEYVYRMTFDMSDLDPTSARITGLWSTDNSAVLHINGTSTSISKSDVGYTSLERFTITAGFVAGSNTLDFRVSNSGGPTGFAVVDLIGTARRGGAPTLISGVFTTGVDAQGAALPSGSPEIHYLLVQAPAGAATPATVLTACPAWVPLPGNDPPTLRASCVPSHGNPSFALQVGGAPAATSIVLLLAAQPSNTPIGGGCDLLVDLTSLAVALHTTADGNGLATFALPVPASQALAGFQLHGQAVVSDPTGPLAGLTFTNGITITVGE